MTSNDEENLLASVLASPDQIAPRLAYADWRTERGDLLGEFMRLQCTPHAPAGRSSARGARASTGDLGRALRVVHRADRS